ncbi:MAG: Gx transporter family protein [Oscillospiraceae bacterium]|jgi:heptaprenyl diphosphate synthase|nr:Gx transporter family protein [Oscillospiraceae bacterium]
MTAKKLARTSLLCALALIVHLIESRIPPFFPFPGIKLGLANAVALAALLSLGAGSAALVQTGRIILGAVFGGGASAFLYSAAGGGVSLLVTLLIYRRFGRRLAFVTGAAGGVAHNLAQLCVAALITRTPQIAVYAPVLTSFGIICGSLTGLLASLVTRAEY